MPNYFAFFQLPEKYALDKKALDVAFQKVCASVSPENVEKATDAYQTLCHPIKRATHLCSIKGYSFDSVSHLSIPTDFIFEQIEWRGYIDNARIEKNLEQLEWLSEQLQHRIKEQIDLIENELDSQNYMRTLYEIKKVLFLEKYTEEINFIFDEIDSANDA